MQQDAAVIRIQVTSVIDIFTRSEIGDRDGWICQLSGDPVHSAWSHDDSLSSGIDWAQPRSEGDEWHPMTVAWWEEWRHSPQAAAMATEVDWRYLLDTALLHHQYWKNGRWEFANEIRMREAKLGATSADRRALKFELEILQEHPVGSLRGNVSDMSAERRKRVAKG